MTEAEHQDDAKSECACDRMDAGVRIMHGAIIEMALMSGQSFGSKRRSLSAILGVLSLVTLFTRVKKVTR